jgi:putative redox protein
MSATLEVMVEQVGPSTSRGVARTYSVLIDRPVAKGGADQGPLGGELLLLSLGGCFMSNLLAAARAREVNLTDARMSVTGTIETGPDRYVGMVLRIQAASTDADTLGKLASIAERACIVTNTLKASVPVTVVVA